MAIVTLSDAETHKPIHHQHIMASLVSQAAFYGGGILLYKNIHHEQRLSSEAYKVDSGWYWDGVHKLLGSEDVVR